MNMKYIFAFDGKERINDSFNFTCRYIDGVLSIYDSDISCWISDQREDKEQNFSFLVPSCIGRDDQLNISIYNKLC